MSRDDYWGWIRQSPKTPLRSKFKQILKYKFHFRTPSSAKSQQVMARPGLFGLNTSGEVDNIKVSRNEDYHHSLESLCTPQILLTEMGLSPRLQPTNKLRIMRSVACLPIKLWKILWNCATIRYWRRLLTLQRYSVLWQDDRGYVCVRKEDVRLY